MKGHTAVKRPHLDTLVAFDAPIEIPDGSGGSDADWTSDGSAVRAWAGIRYLRGGETVQAARLGGRQPAVVTIYATPDSAGITSAWRMRDTNTGVIYNIRTIIPADDPLYLELTVESGVPT